MLNVNLLPEAKRQEYSLRRWRKKMLLLILLAAAVSTGTLFAAAEQVYTARSLYYEAEAEYRLAEPVKKQLLAIKDKRTKAQSEAERLASFFQQRRSAYEQLVYVGINDFSAVQLSRLEFSAKLSTLELSGQADDIRAVNELLSCLSREVIWQDASLAKVGATAGGGLSFAIRLTGQGGGDNAALAAP